MPENEDQNLEPQNPLEPSEEVPGGEAIKPKKKGVVGSAAEKATEKVGEKIAEKGASKAVGWVAGVLAAETGPFAVAVKWITEKVAAAAIKYGLKNWWKFALVPIICIVLLTGIGGVAFASISKAFRGGFGNSQPQYVNAANPDDMAAIRELLGKTPGGMIFPAIKFTKENQGSGSRWKDPGRSDHRGIDRGMDIGTSLYASTDGEVVYLKDDLPDHPAGHNNFGSGDDENGRWGNAIVIKVTSGTWEGFLWEIHHLKQNSSSSLGLSVGTNITKGSLIGLSGHNGTSSGPHIHFQVNKPNGDCERMNSDGSPCNITDDTINPIKPLGW